MNAAEQAINLKTASKIAAIVNLFKSEYPDARSDLKPWANDADTRELVDPDSIDLSFNFPGWSRRFQSRCILIQIRFHQDSETSVRRAIGIEAAGFTHEGKQWTLSTIEGWNFAGDKHPIPEICDSLKEFCRTILLVFNEEIETQEG